MFTDMIREIGNIKRAVEMLAMPTSGCCKFISPVTGDRTAAIKHMRPTAAKAESNKTISFFSVPIFRIIGYIRETEIIDSPNPYSYPQRMDKTSHVCPDRLIQMDVQ